MRKYNRKEWEMARRASLLKCYNRQQMKDDVVARNKLLAVAIVTALLTLLFVVLTIPYWGN